jgi:hypothetical protein
VLADLVVDEVPTHVRATMTEDQIKAVRSAAKKRHAVDLRFTLPLGFTQLYFVFLVGKDTRRETVEVQNERRTHTRIHATTGAIAVAAAIAVIVTAVALYLLKSKAGIDLFPFHARDVVGK